MKLRNLSEAKGQADFTYDPIAKEMWNEKCGEAHKKFNISFNHENDDAISNRTIKIPGTIKECKFACELRSAGGDWEYPVYYFRCQLLDGYLNGISSHSDPYFCVIPGIKDGNPHLVKSKGGYAAPENSEVSDPAERIESKCWEFLNGYLTELASKEVEP